MAFLASAGWGDAARERLPGDASTRRYERLTRGAESALLMVQPEPALKTDYAIAAKLAGNDPLAVVAIGRQLTQRGFSAPKVLASDLAYGLVLLEDLGDTLLARVLEDHPDREADLYGRATDTLAAIYRSTFPAEMEANGRTWTVGAYSPDVLLKETELLPEWYAPEIGMAIDATALEDWRTAWTDVLPVLDAHAPGLVLRDYHAENLFVLDDRDFESATGLIDYQDALFGHPAYDLVSLLQDARRDVDRDVEAQCIRRFCDRARIADTPDFRAAYAVLGAQRAAKIMGIFVRLARRDGKARYLDLLPRVEADFHRNLAHNALTPVRQWWEAHA